MLKSQEIMLAQSKRRERMAEIQKSAEIGDEGRTGLRSLTDASSGAEIEYRAALIVKAGDLREKAGISRWLPWWRLLPTAR